MLLVLRLDRFSDRSLGKGRLEDLFTQRVICAWNSTTRQRIPRILSTEVCEQITMQLDVNRISFSCRHIQLSHSRYRIPSYTSTQPSNYRTASAMPFSPSAYAAMVDVGRLRGCI